MADEKDTVHYDGAEGGWGSVRGIAETMLREVHAAYFLQLAEQGKPHLYGAGQRARRGV